MVKLKEDFIKKNNQVENNKLKLFDKSQIITLHFLLEETKGNLPLFLSPVQVKILPVNNEYHLDYAKKVFNELLDEDIRVELDDREEKVGYRMREAQVKKIPYILVLGQKEVDDNLISFRRHGEQDTTTVSKEEFLKIIKEEIKNKK